MFSVSDERMYLFHSATQEIIAIMKTSEFELMIKMKPIGLEVPFYHFFTCVLTILSSILKLL